MEENKKSNSLQNFSKKATEKYQNDLPNNKTEYYKNPDMNSISSSTIQLEENVKKSELLINTENKNLKGILEEMSRITFSLPSVYTDKLTLDNLERLYDLFKNKVDEKFYEVFVIL